MVKRPSDKEAWELQKMWTDNPPELLEGTGPLTRYRELLRLLDDVSANYLMTVSEKEHKTPAQIIGEMVIEKISMQSA